MPRKPTTTDAFNAIAEPRRRAIIELLAQRGALAVGAIVASLGFAQPDVSKHLAVLREVGIVSVSQDGKQRVYQLEAEALKSVYDWAKAFEQFWTNQMDRIKERAERKAAEKKQDH